MVHQEISAMSMTIMKSKKKKEDKEKEEKALREINADVRESVLKRYLRYCKD